MIHYENCMSLFRLENLFKQYKACRRNKRNTFNALRFEANQELNLLRLQESLEGRTYTPNRSVCFFVKRPKLREIFAADFQDRIVHYVLVAHLEKIWEPIFIHDSYACRKGKGVHAAVNRVQEFMRQVSANQTRPAFVLQLDIRNFFMSIDKERLLKMLFAKLQLSRPWDDEARWLCKQLVNHDCTIEPIIKGGDALLKKLPPHKTLFNAPKGKGLPIGNLNSQFFANVYLNALDQFVKHQLKCRHYVRYCDDFLLMSESQQQLENWRIQIETFIAEQLLLKLNPSFHKIAPVATGVNYLGYIIRPSHLIVRRRVLGHLHERLISAKTLLVQKHEDSTAYLFKPLCLDLLSAQLASYLGHFKLAASHQLRGKIAKQHDWLWHFFERASFLSKVPKALRLDKIDRQNRNVLGQFAYWKERFPGCDLWMQIGAFFEQLQWPPRKLRGAGTRRGLKRGFPVAKFDNVAQRLLHETGPVIFIRQEYDASSGKFVRAPFEKRVKVSERFS
jgi:RNA-directed DNA polymerase